MDVRDVGSGKNEDIFTYASFIVMLKYLIQLTTFLYFLVPMISFLFLSLLTREPPPTHSSTFARISDLNRTK